MPFLVPKQIYTVVQVKDGFPCNGNPAAGVPAQECPVLGFFRVRKKVWLSMLAVERAYEFDASLGTGESAFLFLGLLFSFLGLWEAFLGPGRAEGRQIGPSRVARE